MNKKIVEHDRFLFKECFKNTVKKLYSKKRFTTCKGLYTISNHSQDLRQKTGKSASALFLTITQDCFLLEDKMGVGTR